MRLLLQHIWRELSKYGAVARCIRCLLEGLSVGHVVCRASLDPPRWECSYKPFFPFWLLAVIAAHFFFLTLLRTVHRVPRKKPREVPILPVLSLSRRLPANAGKAPDAPGVLSQICGGSRAKPQPPPQVRERVRRL